MALEYQSVLSVRFLHTYVLLLIFFEARAVHESESLYQSLRQNMHSEIYSIKKRIDKFLSQCYTIQGSETKGSS